MKDATPIKPFSKLKAERGIKGKSLKENDWNGLTRDDSGELRRHVEDDHKPLGLDYSDSDFDGD